MQTIGFKEWALVCEALGRGEQSIIVRKGGIAEGREGFAFRHPEFFLFPTWFHEQPEKVQGAEIKLTAPLAGQIEIKYFAKLELTRTVRSIAIAEGLAPLHILRPEVIRERFAYDEAPGVQVAFVRVFRLSSAWKFSDEKRFGGCRSWVTLPEAPGDLEFEAVLSDADHEKRRSQFLKTVGATSQSVLGSTGC